MWKRRVEGEVIGDTELKVKRMGGEGGLGPALESRKTWWLHGKDIWL